MDSLVIKGARQHNLKDIDLTLPKNTLIVFTGMSGSGKSSLAFDTIYAEGQRRYVESLSSYARQFLGIMDKPDVDSIEGLSPAISIDQKGTSHNPRSTVGTVTEIYDYLRLLFARIGHPHCPNCGREIEQQSSEQIVQSIVTLAKTERGHALYIRFMILAPVVRDRKGEFSGMFENLKAKGYRQVRVDGHIMDIGDDIFLIKTNKHTVDVVIDKLQLDTKTTKSLTETIGKNERVSHIRMRVFDAVSQALNLSQGLVTVAVIRDPGFTMPERPKHSTDHIFSQKYACPVCNISLTDIEPRTFSFNSPHGACPICSGIGTLLTVDPALVLSLDISISEGGILPFAKTFLHDSWYARVITTVCAKHDIDIQKPLRMLSKQQKNVLLFGTGDTIHTVHGKNRFGEQTTIQEAFAGIVPELKRRYIQSESDWSRMEIEKYMREEICPSCGGKRLKKESLTITIDGLSIDKVTDKSIREAREWVGSLSMQTQSILSPTESIIAKPILKEIGLRLSFLDSVGLEYLTLSRSAHTLAGGEAQRIRLASQIGSGLSGVLYVLDEPSIGLHQRDNMKLINTLKKLRDLGNTVIVVEHDREMMEEADYLVDFGPGAGKHGGSIVAEGTVSEVKHNPKSVTAPYLKSHGIKTNQNHLSNNIQYTNPLLLTISGVRHNNLKHISVSFPLGKFTCVTGVSGSGKSSLIVETLYRAIHTHFIPTNRNTARDYDRIEGLEHTDKVILIDQSPIGRTPRSNPATYTGVFTLIREVFAMLPDAKLRGFAQGRFSFNVRGGRCEACEGEGQKKIEMQFLSDIYVTCEVCHGLRYNSETLEVAYHEKSIAQVLEMTVDDAKDFFTHHPMIREKLTTLSDVGLGYIHLGQSATTLSGGEAQRVKLATELSKRATGKTVYILDEPTTGLHFADLEKLLTVLHRLTDKGNTIIVIEHNLDMIANADWIVDLGPEGGDAGGYIVCQGSPEDVSRNTKSYTGQFLKKIRLR